MTNWHSAVLLLSHRALLFLLLASAVSGTMLTSYSITKLFKR